MPNPFDARILLSPRCCGDVTEKFNTVPLDTAIPQKKVRGVQNPSSPSQFPTAGSTYKEWNGRQRAQTVTGNESSWQLYRQINGHGYLCNLFGMSKNLEIRITIDGNQSITFYSQGTTFNHLMWGFWTQRSGQVEGFYYQSGFGVLSREYLFNFVHGCVEFQSQLRIEYKNKSSGARHTLAMDYLMESEILEIEL
mgnify:CR=1 FL=1